MKSIVAVAALLPFAVGVLLAAAGTIGVKIAAKSGRRSVGSFALALSGVAALLAGLMLYPISFAARLAGIVSPLVGAALYFAGTVGFAAWLWHAAPGTAATFVARNVRIPDSEPFPGWESRFDIGARVLSVYVALYACLYFFWIFSRA